MDDHNLKIVPTDLFRRHFLVYDELYKKIGSLDKYKGFWTFTRANSSDTWFGYSRDDALASFLRFSDTPASPAVVLAYMG